LRWQISRICADFENTLKISLDVFPGVGTLFPPKSEVVGMPQEQKDGFKYTARFFTTGLLMQGVVFLTPGGGVTDKASFLTIARSSVWGDFWNWLAAWCSLKIILLSFGGFLVTVALEEFCLAQKREGLARLFFSLIFLPIAVFWFGFYYLLKAIF
jgi:hypothetical protein